MRIVQVGTEVSAEIGPRRFPAHLLHIRLCGKPEVIHGRKEQGAKIKIYSASGSVLGIITATLSSNTLGGRFF